MKKILVSALATLALVYAPVAQAKTIWTGTVSVSTYTSSANQTDSTPFITATGTRVRHGVVAVSRDLLRYGYGSKLRIVNWTGGSGCNHMVIPQGVTYRIEDTMNARWNNKVDIWLPSYNQAIRFGRCSAVVEISK